MYLRRLCLSAAFVMMGCDSLPAQGANEGSLSKQAQTIPARTLRCVLGRATNLDPFKDQSLADVKYEGRHNFTLFLPAAPMREGSPPDPSDPPEPVNPATRIVADPDGLAAGVPARFDRVVDLWPERVEMITSIDPPLSNLIIVHPIDAQGGTANLFMTKAADAASLDLNNVFQGKCKIHLGEQKVQ